MQYNPQRCAEQIQPIIKQTPKVAVILGSGLSGLANQLSDASHIHYDQIDGYPTNTIAGHNGTITAGTYHGESVICLQGRAHRYEGPHAHTLVKNIIRSLKLLGVEHLILTNAAGSLNPDMPPGSLMMITDHINMQLDNPLVGDNDDDFGPRFPPIDQAYTPTTQALLRDAAKATQIKLHEGNYICVMGPSYETAAEISAFKMLGGNAIGMSTIPEVIVANHCGLKITAVSVITNFATGLASEQHAHDKVVAAANHAAKDLERLLEAFFLRMKNESI